MRIGVDIDGCVVDTPDLWFKWLSERYHLTAKGKIITKSNLLLPYDLSEIFEVDEVEAFNFWRNPYLYVGLRPMRDSVDVLKTLQSEGHEIVFISACKGFHHKSKWEFIEKHFPFHSGVVFTKEKWLLGEGLDVMIDDRLSVLSSMPEKVKRIQMCSDFEQDGFELTTNNHTVVCNWWDVCNIVTGG